MRIRRRIRSVIGDGVTDVYDEMMMSDLELRNRIMKIYGLDVWLDRYHCFFRESMKVMVSREIHFFVWELNQSSNDVEVGIWLMMMMPMLVVVHDCDEVLVDETVNYRHFEWRDVGTASQYQKG